MRIWLFAYVYRRSEQYSPRRAHRANAPGRVSGKGRTSPFRGEGGKVWNRRSAAIHWHQHEKEALFFPSVATLAEADPYEGEPLPAKFRAAQAGGPDDLRTFRFHCEMLKHLNFYNSWHMNDGESDAMWKLYLKGSQGIAIQSTVERIQSSFQNTVTHPVYMALVEYIDYENFMPPSAHGSLEWAERVATWSSRDGWSGDSRPDAEWLQ
jgi:hypothetical protein